MLKLKIRYSSLLYKNEINNVIFQNLHILIQIYALVTERLASLFILIDNKVAQLGELLQYNCKPIIICQVNQVNHVYNNVSLNISHVTIIIMIISYNNYD